MISSELTGVMTLTPDTEFQSRNRGSFDFKFTLTTAINTGSRSVFQSRNRGSFDFKLDDHIRKSMTPKRFNLVIEVLLISSLFLVIFSHSPDKFQSRNRGSFDFKILFYLSARAPIAGFNLVIEVLLISRIWFEFITETGCRESFNLVIEVLLISSTFTNPDLHAVSSFQSRNRGSFDFKLIMRGNLNGVN